MSTEKTGHKRELEAVVLKDKMDKTVVVQVKRIEMHKQVKKYRYVFKKYKAHDENNECRVGDTVVIRETRPLSKEKRWEVIKIVEKAAA